MSNPQATSDKKLVAFGVFWNSIQLAINLSFSFIIKLVLARLLFPEQFGIVGMATVFTSFVEIVNDLGIGAALIQRKANKLRPAHFHTAFWMGVIWAITLYLLMCFLIGPLASWFYKEPLLETIMPVLSLGILSSPINLVHRAQLMRQMNFKKTAFIESVAKVFAGCLALTLAFMGAGVWSLVFNTVASFLVSIPLYFRATGWKPAFVFEKEALRDMLGFGMYTTGGNMLNYVYNRMDFFLIGKILGATSVGIYSLAFVLTDTFKNQVMRLINRVVYPLYGKHQRNPGVLKKYYLKVVQFNCIVVFPPMLFFLVFGPAFLIGLFGAKWEESGLPLQILSVAMMFHMTLSGNTALLRGLGRPGLELKLQIIKTLLFVPTLFIGIYYYGTVGAAYAVLLNKIITVLITQYVFKKLLSVKISNFEFIAALKIPITASFVASVAGYLMWMMQFSYLIGGAVLLTSYGGTIWILMGSELKILLKQFRKEPGTPASI